MQCSHNNFRSSENTPPGYFLIIRGADGSTLYLCAGSNYHVLFSEEDKKMLANALAVEDMSIPQNSVLFGHGYIQHADLDGEVHMTS